MRIQFYLNRTFNNLILAVVLLFSYSNATAQTCTIFPKNDFDSTYINRPIKLNVTGNDVTTDGGTTHIISDSLYIVSNTSHGTIQVLNDTQLIYVPNLNFVGSDFGSYIVCRKCPDGSQSCDTADFTINVICPKPGAKNDSVTVYNNKNNTPFNPTLNDIDTAGGLTAAIVKNGKHGVASLTGNNIKYLADSTNYFGNDTVWYKSCNVCGKCDTAMIVYKMRSCLSPKAMMDTATVMQGQTVNIAYLLNDSNINGYGTIMTNILHQPKFGTATEVLPWATIKYTPNNVYYGYDSIYYSVLTDCGMDSQLIRVLITQAPCTAPKAKLDNFQVGNSIACINKLNVLANDTNPVNSGKLKVTILTQPTIGVVTYNADSSGLIFTLATGQVSGATSSFKYMITNNCGVDSALATVLVSNFPCNGNPPKAIADYASVCSNDGVCINVIANDYDVDGNSVSLDTVNSILVQPKHGIAYRKDSATICYFPTPGYYGADTFNYQIVDNGTPGLNGNNQVYVTVNACNLPPVITENGKSVDTIRVTYPEDSFIVYCFTYTDPQGDSVTISTASSSAPQTNTYTPNTGFSLTHCDTIRAPKNYNGQNGYWVKICNEFPSCDSVWVIATVTPREDPPVAVDDSLIYANATCINVVRNDMDPDKGDILKIHPDSIMSAFGGKAVKTSDSTYCYTPDPNFTGVDTFIYVLCDSSNKCDTATVYVVVGIQARDDYRTTIQEQSILIDVRHNDTYTNNDSLTLCSTPLHGTATVQGDSILYVPADDYPYDPIANNNIGTGLDSFCYTLCNVKNGVKVCDNAMVYITITPKPNFKIPQAMSPNGDGSNDNFVIPSVDEYPTSQMMVYNRYGDEVWRNDGEGYKNDFAGNFKLNNKPLPDGSYWYIFKFNKDNLKDRIGYIVIHR